MTLFEPDDAIPTLTVGQITRRLSDAVKRSFSAAVWVQGQIRNLSRSARGHVYFDLIDPVAAGTAPTAALKVVLFDSNRQIVNRIITRTGNNVRFEDGIEVRVRGTIEVYAPRGDVQLNMTSIDPEFTLGRLGADRERLVRDLRADGSIDANRSVPIPVVPLRVALVTSAASAAEADFVDEIAASGYAFDVTVVATRVQGMFAPGEIAAAIEQAGRLDVDVVAVVRGGGARTDLAAFDAQAVARAIVECPHPVLCGIGHEIDESVADLVAHASLKTPTACAQFLIERVVAFDFALADRATQVAARARLIPLLHQVRVDTAAGAVAVRVEEILGAAHSRNAQAAASLERRVLRRIARSNQRLASTQARLRVGAHQALVGAERRCVGASARLGEHPGRVLGAESARLDLAAARLSAVDPTHAMARGWSITTDAQGRLLRGVADLGPGDPIITRLADGTVASTVTEATPASVQEHE